MNETAGNAEGQETPNAGSGVRESGTYKIGSQPKDSGSNPPRFDVRKVSSRLSNKARRMMLEGSKRLARRNLLLLAAQGNLTESLKDIPENMHLVARQTRLVIEFIDDFRSGKYRDVPWWAVAVAVTAMLYAINPADVIPNVIPILGTVDDLAMVAVAVRLLRSELIRYCEFKGYPREEYFRS